MTNQQLLPDMLLGHLLCVYLKLYDRTDGTYHVVINFSDPIAYNLDHFQVKGVWDKKITLGAFTIALMDQYKRVIKVSAQQALHPGVSQQSYPKQYNQKLQYVKSLLKKYKPHESSISDSDLKKIKEDKELYDSLACVITINQEQYKNLSSFIKEYNSLYSNKELGGQQNYLLPSNYVDKVLSYINDPEYVKAYGYNNLRIHNQEVGEIPNFCHTLMYLVLQKKIKLRKMLIAPQSVDINLDNLSKDT